MYSIKSIVTRVSILAALLASASFAAEPLQSLDPKTRDQSIDSIAQLLQDRYAIESDGNRYAALLRSNLVAGSYSAITDGNALARRLTSDLQALHPDRHLNVHFSPEVLPPPPHDWKPTPEQRAQMLAHERRTNAGFDKLEVLPGNVGYISFTYFGDPDVGAPKIAAAMQFVSDTSALIIDLRRNGGATHLALMDLLTRYLVEDSKIVTAKTTWRGEAPDFIKNPLVLPVTAPRYLGKPVYLLTSERTFSGAEGFAYNLQAMKRVTVVGERTGGGANPGGTLRAADHFSVWVPAAIVEHPITKTNWEGVGIIPEIEVDVEQAHIHAHLAALNTALEKPADDHRWNKHLEEQKNKLTKQLAHREPTRPVEFKLAGYPDAQKVTVYGSFNDWTGRKATMKRDGDTWKAKLELPLGRHTYKFRIDDDWITDPTNPVTEKNEEGHISSILEVKS